MAENHDPKRSARRNSRWPAYAQYLFIVFLTLLFLSLAVSMERHHFFSGSDDEQNSSATR